jgi:hypothetical protein
MSWTSLEQGLMCAAFTVCLSGSGYMRISGANAAAWTKNTEANTLRHDSPYLLTAPRGGVG